VKTFSIFWLAAILFYFSVGSTEAQTDAKSGFSSYKEIRVGMKADAVRTKLGKPRDTSDANDYFVFSDNESAQVLYDTNHAVRVISVNYTGNLSSAPKPKDIFGADVEAKPDGSINKMVRFPKLGYWVSYLRTGGDDPMIMVTIQKMQSEQ
jgi:hypothetical protein